LVEFSAASLLLRGAMHRSERIKKAMAEHIEAAAAVRSEDIISRKLAG
jgi:hypothetical protein